MLDIFDAPLFRVPFILNFVSHMADVANWKEGAGSSGVPGLISLFNFTKLTSFQSFYFASVISMFVVAVGIPFKKTKMLSLGCVTTVVMAK